MGQPQWEDWERETTGQGPFLSPRQREWIVTLPDDAIVEVLDNAEDGSLEIVCHHNGVTTDDTIPWDGKIDQPVVRLVDPEQEIADLPTAERRQE